MVPTDKILDIKGLARPRAEVVTRNTLAGMLPGQVLMVITTCRTIKQEMFSLCQGAGCTVLQMQEDGGNLCIQIQKAQPAALPRSD